MKQVINRKGAVRVRDVAAPQCGRGQVLIALTHSLISSGTESHTLNVTGQNLASRAKDRPDLVKKVIDRARTQGVMAAYEAVQEKLNEPKAMGYSASGIVIEIGEGVTRFAPGDRVACGGSTASHGEVVSVPENLVVAVPEGMDLKHACFATLGAIAMQGIRRAQTEFGDNVVILGLGLVGQLCLQMAKVAGVRVLGFDLAADRTELAKALGADAAYPLGDVDALERVSDFTDGVGADAVVVSAATKSSGPINDAVAMCRERGRISVVGIIGLDVLHNPIYMKELDVYMSRSYGPGRYDPQYEEQGLDYPISFVRWTENRNMAEVLRLIAEGHVDVESLISSVYPIGRAEEAYEALQSGEGRPLGIVIEYPEAEATKPRFTTVAEGKATRPQRKQTGIAVVGCGGFCKKDRLPYLRRDTNFVIERLVSGTGAKVQELASQFGVKKHGTDYREALADDAIDCLVVASPNGTHGPITIDAAKAGKDVFVEKPMAVNREELEAVRSAVEASGIRCACGFNRRYAPASVALKAFTSTRKKPYTIFYRCNVGLTPPGHVMHPLEEGGGLIMGEACHFFDYCNWLTGAEPISVSAFMPTYDGAQFVATDNMSALVKYADGSVATIVYTTMGDTSLPKERVEVYTGGAVGLLDDYTSVSFYGAKDKGWSGAQDKGHKALMKEVGRALSAGEDLPIGFDASYLSHVLSLNALESVRTGQVIQVG